MRGEGGRGEERRRREEGEGGAGRCRHGRWWEDTGRAGRQQAGRGRSAGSPAHPVPLPPPPPPSPSPSPSTRLHHLHSPTHPKQHKHHPTRRPHHARMQVACVCSKKCVQEGWRFCFCSVIVDIITATAMPLAIFFLDTQAGYMQVFSCSKAKSFSQYHCQH